MPNYLNVLLICLAAASLAACSDVDASHESQNPIQVPPGWTADDVDLTCANPNLCPDNQGILFSFTKVESSNGYTRTLNLSMFRCTGTIYQTDKVLTAGHCVNRMKNAQEIYFKTAAKPGVPSRTFRVKQPVAGVEDVADLLSADFGAFELAEPATGIALAHPALSLPKDVHEMLGFVVNPISEDRRQYTLDAVPCQHSAYLNMPLSYDDNPTTFALRQCKIYSGNSGGVLVLANDPLSVLGVLHASNNAHDSNLSPEMSHLMTELLKLRNLLGSNPAPGKKIDEAIATNARCFQLPGWPLSEPKCVELNSSNLKPYKDRLEAARAKEQLKLFAESWFAGTEANFSNDLKFWSVPRVVAFDYSDLEDLMGKHGFGLAAWPRPTCRTSDSLGQSKYDVTFTPKSFTMGVDPETEKTTFVPTPVALRIHVHLEHVAGDQYQLLYTYDNIYPYRFSLTYKSDVKNVPGQNETITLPLCQGNEKAYYVEGLAK